MLTKRNISKFRTDHLFNLIERGENEKVIDFFKTFPELINKILSQHEWTPVMYACRYGNFGLLKTFSSIGFKIDKENVPSLLHLTCYSENMQIIEYLLNTIERKNLDITSLLRISAILNKQEITLFFMVNGGLVIDNRLDPPQILNGYPATNGKNEKSDGKVVYMDPKSGEEVKCKALKIKDQKQTARDVLIKILPYAKKYKFELATTLVKNHPKKVKQLQFNKILKFLNENQEFYDDVAAYL